MPGWYILYSDESGIQNNLGFESGFLWQFEQDFFSLSAEVLAYLKIYQARAVKLGRIIKYS